MIVSVCHWWLFFILFVSSAVSPTVLQLSVDGQTMVCRTDLLSIISELFRCVCCGCYVMCRGRLSQVSTSLPRTGVMMFKCCSFECGQRAMVEVCFERLSTFCICRVYVCVYLSWRWREDLAYVCQITHRSVAIVCVVVLFGYSALLYHTLNAIYVLSSGWYLLSS